MSWGRYTDLKVIREMLSGALKALIDWLDGGAVWRVEASTADLKVYYRALRCYAGGTWYSIAAGAATLGSAPTSDTDYFVYVSTAGVVTVAAADPGGGTFRLAKVHTPAGTLPASLTAINDGLNSDQRALLTAPGGTSGEGLYVAAENDAVITVNTSYKKVAEVGFTLSTQQTIAVHFTVVVQAAASGVTVSIQTSLDATNHTMTAQQILTAAGYWTVSFQLPFFNVAAGDRTVIVRMKTDTGSVTIAASNAQLGVTATGATGGTPVDYAPVIDAALLAGFMGANPTETVAAASAAANTKTATLAGFMSSNPTATAEIV